MTPTVVLQSEDDDLDDDAMFKLDESLAAVFKNMQKSKRAQREQECQLLQYRMRCLDLIDVLIDNCNSQGLLVVSRKRKK